jgi:hypothetical protein
LLLYLYMSRKVTKEEFIRRSILAHGGNDKYDYSRVDYIDTQTKVLIGYPKML